MTSLEDAPEKHCRNAVASGRKTVSDALTLGVRRDYCPLALHRGGRSRGGKLAS